MSYNLSKFQFDLIKSSQFLEKLFLNPSQVQCGSLIIVCANTFLYNLLFRNVVKWLDTL